MAPAIKGRFGALPCRDIAAARPCAALRRRIRSPPRVFCRSLPDSLPSSSAVASVSDAASEVGERGAAQLQEFAETSTSAATELLEDPVAAAASAVVAENASAADAAGAVSDAATTAALDAAVDASTSAVDPGSATSAIDAAASALADDPARYDGFLSPLSDTLEKILGVLQHGLEILHVPYSYGFSIILLTVFVRTATYPLTKKQAEVSMAAMQLKPTIDRIKRRYGDDKDKINRETARLYELTKINPLAGCLPSLASIPIFLGLYYSLGNVANEGVLENEGFFWIPSLAGPTSLALRKSGAGTAWLFPLENGVPPIGWHDAAAYLVLPTALVAIQYLLSALITPPKDPEAEENETLQFVTKLLPLMLGWFSLNVPAGLTLYYFSNVSLVSAQQVYLRKLGGATVDLGIDLPEEKYGVGRRRMGGGEDNVLVEGAAAEPSQVILVDEVEAEAAQGTRAQVEADLASNGLSMAADAAPAEAEAPAVMAAEADQVEEAGEATIDRRCKRKRLVPAPGSAMALVQKGMIPLSD